MTKSASRFGITHRSSERRRAGAERQWRLGGYRLGAGTAGRRGCASRPGLGHAGDSARVAARGTVVAVGRLGLGSSGGKGGEIARERGEEITVSNNQNNATEIETSTGSRLPGRKRLLWSPIIFGVTTVKDCSVQYATRSAFSKCRGIIKAPEDEMTAYFQHGLVHAKRWIGYRFAVSSGRFGGLAGDCGTSRVQGASGFRKQLDLTTNFATQSVIESTVSAGATAGRSTKMEYSKLDLVQEWRFRLNSHLTATRGFTFS
uniref:Uncharacterized protein n=1 Tax=Oryza glumipatula TaxID=40148 RepID=A0A0D9YHC0_9ORYZ